MSMRRFCMIKERRVLAALLFAVSAFSAVHAQQKTGDDAIEFSIPVELQSLEVSSREVILKNNVFPQIRQGDRLMKEKNFSAACKAYKRALIVFLNSGLEKNGQVKHVKDLIEARIEKSRRKWGQAVFDDAKKIYLNGLVEKDSKKAISEFRKAQTKALASLAPYYLGEESASQDQLDNRIRKDKSFNQNVQSLIMDCNKMEEAYNFREETSLSAIDPDYKHRNEEIDRLLRMAEVHYRNRQFEKVRTLVEKVLVLDPYNQKGVTLLNKTYKKLYRIGMARAENDAMEQMAEVEWKWNEPIPPNEAVNEESGPKEMTGTRAELYEKLQKTIVDKIEYESADIQSILENLASQYGIIIVPPSKLEDRSRKIQYLELEKTPLLDVIRYICEVAGLKFKVEEKAVFVGVQNNEEMEIGFFEVRKSLVQRIMFEAGAGETSADKNEGSKDSLKDADRFSDKSLTEAAKGDSGSDAKKSPEPTPEMLKQFFTPMGIEFPEGSTISYDKGNGKLIMKNLTKYLQRMETLLKEIDTPPPLVLVDSKVMEVSMNALEELGFDWLLTYTDKETSRQFQFSGLSSDSFYRSTSHDYLINNLKILPNFGGNNQFNLSLSVRALDQKDRSEMLATPRLLVVAGYPGKLTIAEERYFPDSWTDAEIEIVNGTSYTYKAPTPEFADATNVGTIFTVKPTVSSNNYTILLNIDTDLSRMTGWSNYDYSIVIGSMLFSPANTSSTNFQPKVKMPEFSKRKLKSTVKIYDGETVVIGGILEDIASRREDKWPLLGDIPLFGRLFTDSTFASEKVNLMMFVTARLMKGNGLPIHAARKQGLFEFNDR